MKLRSLHDLVDGGYMVSYAGTYHSVHTAKKDSAIKYNDILIARVTHSDNRCVISTNAHNIAGCKYDDIAVCKYDDPVFTLWQLTPVE